MGNLRPCQMLLEDREPLSWCLLPKARRRIVLVLRLSMVANVPFRHLLETRAREVTSDQA